MSDDQAAGRARRINTDLAAQLTDSQGTEFEVTILDLSASGFRLRSSEPLEKGERVELRSGKGPAQPARIQWVSGEEAGGLFLVPPDQTP